MNGHRHSCLLDLYMSNEYAKLFSNLHLNLPKWLHLYNHLKTTMSAARAAPQGITWKPDTIRATTAAQKAITWKPLYDEC